MAQRAVSKQAVFVPNENRSFVSSLGKAAMLGHPDGRNYPWMQKTASNRKCTDCFLLLREVEMETVAFRFAELEAGVALARSLGRALVVPSIGEFIDHTALQSLVRLSTQDELQTHLISHTVGVARVCASLSCDEPWMDGRPSRADVPAWPSMTSTYDKQLHLNAPIRGPDEVRHHLGDLDEYAVLILDCAAVHRLIAPASIIDPYLRQAHLMPAFRPNDRVRRRLRTFLDGAKRPYIAVRAPLAECADVAMEVARKLQGTANPAAAWLSADKSDDIAQPLAAALRASGVTAAHIPLMRSIPSSEGDDVAEEVLRLWVCALADYFVGSCRSIDSEWVRKLRVDSGKLVEHCFLTVRHEQPAKTGTAGVYITPEDITGVALTMRPSMSPGCECTAYAQQGRHGRQATSWRLRARASRQALTVEQPVAAKQHVQWEPPALIRGQELFDHFISDQLPVVRALPLRPALPLTTGRVAFIIEPRRHSALEHVVRNVSHFLGSDWQLQIFHGTANASYVKGLFSPGELERIQFVSLQVDNLSRDAYSELLCSHWLWTRVAAETTLLFQTDVLLCGGGIERFVGWDYIGAPWDTREAWCRDHEWLHHAGNGGLTVRSRSGALVALDAIEYSCGAPEDLYFVDAIPRIGRSLAPRSVARRFSVESPLAEDEEEGRPVVEQTVGMHAAYKFLPHDRTVRLLHSIATAYHSVPSYSKMDQPRTF